MSTTEHVEACARFADALLRGHHSTQRSLDDPVQRCACGRAMVLCEINSAARDAGLLAPITGPAGPLPVRLEPEPGTRPAGPERGQFQSLASLFPGPGRTNTEGDGVMR